MRHAVTVRAHAGESVLNAATRIYGTERRYKGVRNIRESYPNLLPETVFLIHTDIEVHMRTQYFCVHQMALFLCRPVDVVVDCLREMRRLVLRISGGDGSVLAIEDMFYDKCEFGARPFLINWTSPSTSSGRITKAGVNITLRATDKKCRVSYDVERDLIEFDWER